MRIQPEENMVHASINATEEVADITRGVLELATPQITPQDIGANGLLLFPEILNALAARTTNVKRLE